MSKTLKCKNCGEEVEVPDRQLSVVCRECASKTLAEREFSEDPPSPELAGAVHDALGDPRFRRGYLHRKVLQRKKQI